jgi:hypothetical protein
MQTADKLYSLEDGEDSPTALSIHLGDGTSADNRLPYKAEPDADPNDVIGAACRDPAEYTAEVGIIAGRDCWVVRRRPG